MLTASLYHGSPVPVPANDALRVRPCRQNEYTMVAIARRLGMVDRPRRSIIDRIRLLVEKQGFPLPKTPRFVSGIRQFGASAIDARSIWDKDAVDIWFENDLPPHESRERITARRASVSAELGKRALLLVASR